MAIRTGRFKSDKNVDIAEGKALSYRIHNTGNNSINVTSGGTTSELMVDCSLDVNDTTMSIAPKQANKEIEGVYDRLNGQTTVRSGRFVSDKAVTATIVASSAQDDFYRILNSGESSLTVRGGSSDHVLKPKMSIDVSSKNPLAVESGAKGGSCIYYALDDNTVVRSGRFSATLGANTTHVVIDPNNKLGAFYRFFNSSDTNTLKLVEKNGISWTVLKEIAPGNSFDIEIGRKTVGVQAKTAGDTIEGIYDFLGE